MELETLINGTRECCTWMVAQFVDDYTKVERDMSSKLGYSVKEQIKNDKLLPHVALAVPIWGDTIAHCDGKLFTLLPLPISTKFPLHIHSVFALTSDRQRLRNAQEKVDAKSREQLLIEWNRYIFNSIVPQAWSNLLQILVQAKPNLNIYSAWPSISSVSNIGDAAYWNNVPINLLQVAASRAVWPVMKGGYFMLGDVMIADGSQSESTVIQALLAANVPISQVPNHLIQLAAIPPGKHRSSIMSPATVASFLKTRIPFLERLCKKDRDAISEYISSGDSLQLFSTLPLFTNVSGTLVAINLSKVTILANEEEADLFSTQEPNMLGLEDIPPVTRRLILRSNSFTRVSDSQIIQYLQRFRSASSGSPDTTEWLCRLWRYLGSKSQVQRLIRQLSDYYLIPDDKEALHRVPGRVLDSNATATHVGKVINTFGLPFLHPSVKMDAKRCLNSYGMIATLNDVAFLLDKMADSSIPSLDLASARCLHQHFENYIGNLKLTEGQRGSLRRLPIFPVVQSGRRETYPDADFRSANLRCYFVDRNVLVIPSIKETLFFDASQCRNLMVALDTGPTLSEIDVLKLTLEEKVWWNQPNATTVALLDRIANRFSDLYDDLDTREKIRRLPFVDVGAGKRRAPGEVVDPLSSIADLFDENDEVKPVSYNDRLLQRLRENGMMKTQLTREIIEDRLRKRHPDRSVKLLQLVDDYLLQRSAYRGTSMTSELLPSSFTTTPWLYASNSFRSPDQCRDRPSSDSTVFLYDLVVPIVDYAVCSHALRNVLGWGPVDCATLKEQLKKALDLPYAGAAPRLEAIILDLSKAYTDGRCSSRDLDDLRTLLSALEWIPVADGLRSSRYCLLEAVDFGPMSGFIRVPYKLRSSAQAKRFLEEMGVRTRPSKSALLESIQRLEHKAGPQNTTLVIKCAIDLLTELVSSYTLGEEERKELRIPTRESIGGVVRFEFISDVCFDNSTSKTGGVSDGVVFAHSSISRELADRLGLERWTDREFGDLDDPEFSSYDVGEEATTRIKNLLHRGYTIESSCNEWVANAADAGASSVTFYLNDLHPKVGKTPSPTLPMFFQGPSLLVHNTSVFSEEDFRGLQKTGLGGKANRHDAIGRFGLGVLSFYHFGDIIILISGDSVVFLDPSEQHLPRKSFHEGGGKRSGMKMALSVCLRRYPDIFYSVEGIEGFDPSKGFYNGTIFLIPLRTSQHVVTSKISDRPCHVAHVKNNIFRAFFDQAESSLFFSRLAEIKACYRATKEDMERLWLVQAERAVEEISDNGMTHQYVTLRTCLSSRNVQSRWLTVSYQSPLLDDFRVLAPHHRLPDPVNVSLAFQVSRTRTVNDHWMFAHLPLPIKTDLRFHLDGRWILSDDRRNIRLESANERHPGLDTSFNKWLLSEMVPTLLIEAIAIASQENEARSLAQLSWPKGGLSLLSDQLVAQGVYNKFPSSIQPICRVQKDERDIMMSPQDAIFGVHGNYSVNRLLARLLPNFVTPPLSFDSNAVDWKSLKTDTPELARSTIASKASDILANPSVLTDRSIKLDEIVSYLIGGSQSIAGLPLLPLHNGTLSCFEEAGRTSVFAFSQDIVALFGSERVMAQDALSEATITALMETNTVNLRSITKEGVRELLRDSPLHIIPCDEMTPADAGVARTWLEGFWGDGSRLRRLGIGIDLTSVVDLPLLPTTDGRLVSLTSCDIKNPFWKPMSDQESFHIINFLSQFGATIIDLFPHSTLSELNVASSADLQRVLKILSSLSPATPDSMTTSPQWPMFAGWVRSNTRLHILSHLLKQHPILNNLRIWEARRPRQSSSPAFKSLSEVMMLPLGITLSDVEQYLGNEERGWYTDYSYELDGLLTANQNYHWRKLSQADVFSRVQWPNAITAEEIVLYRRLMELIRSSDPTSLRNRAIFPNGRLELCRASSLYESSVQLYKNAFMHQPNRFVHPQFHDLLSWLAPLGLINTVTAEGFMTSVTAIDEAVQQELATPLDRIGVVFTTLNQNPWLFNEADRIQFWPTLRCLRFVSSSGVLTPHPAFQTYRANVGAVASLEQLVLSEYSPIAWTQRACFTEEPTADLRFVFGELGQPSVEEVVNHLVSLSMISRADRPNAPMLLSHLKATYRWLNERSEEARPYLASRLHEPLFVNHESNDPDLTTCLWHSAQTMWLNVSWDDEASSVYSVKGFLLPFIRLVEAAGVRPYPSAVYQASDMTATAHSEEIHSNVATLYQQDRWTDVVLLLDDGESIKAHRLILAAASSYFMNLFTGDFREASIQATPEKPVQVRVADHSLDGVRRAIQYVYTGTFDLPSCNDSVEASAALQLLMKLLDLSNLWAMHGLKRKAERAVVDLKLVTPSTVEDIIRWCENAGAEELRMTCLKVQEEAGRIGWRGQSES
ncbi:hypothetical protein FRC02_006144 [Tulasnella sp. 418]|nr:hypothetical protein FRC02_006144 [Tulasnella sp. 418]